MKSKENVSLRTHHPPEPEAPLLACSICHLLFDKQVSLMTHMEITHLKAFEFQCCVCSLTFGRRKILSLHLRTVHSMDVVTAEEIIDEQQNEVELNCANLGYNDVENNVTYIENEASTSDGIFDPLKSDHGNGISPIKIKLHSGDIKQNGSSAHSKQRLNRPSAKNCNAFSASSKSNSNRSYRLPDDHLGVKKRELNEDLHLVEELSNWPDVGTKIWLKSKDERNDNLSNKNNSDDDDDNESRQDSNYGNYVEAVMSDEDDNYEPDSTKKNLVAKSIKKEPRKIRSPGKNSYKGIQFYEKSYVILKT